MPFERVQLGTCMRQDALRALIEEKKPGDKITRVEEPEDTTNVVDLMAALKKSLTGGGGRSAPKKGGLFQHRSTNCPWQNQALSVPFLFLTQ
jgi:hypothetical protein